MTAPDAACIARLRRASTATLTTQMFKRGFRNVFMQGVTALGAYDANMVGPAYTLRNIPAREDLDGIDSLASPDHPQRKAIEHAPSGHVMVIDCRGEARAACAGEILVTRLMVRGAAGLVADGGIRDAGPIGALAMPVFCAGPSAPLNLVHHHAVEIDVIPAHLAEEVALAAAEQEHLERFVLAQVAAGAGLPGTYPPDEATKAAYAAWRAANKLD